MNCYIQGICREISHFLVLAGSFELLPTRQRLNVCKMPFIQSSIDYECEDEFFENFAEISSSNSPYVVCHLITEAMFCWGVFYIHHSKENQSCSNNICIQYEVHKPLARCWLLLSISNNITPINQIPQSKERCFVTSRGATVVP